jgi:hypothetical protein
MWLKAVLGTLLIIGIGTSLDQMVEVPVGDCNASFNLTETDFENLDHRLLTSECKDDRCTFTISIKDTDSIDSSREKIYNSKVILYRYSSPQDMSELQEKIVECINQFGISERNREEIVAINIGQQTLHGYIGGGYLKSDTLEKWFVICYWIDNYTFCKIYSPLQEPKITRIVNSLQIECHAGGIG